MGALGYSLIGVSSFLLLLAIGAVVAFLTCKKRKSAKQEALKPIRVEDPPPLPGLVETRETYYGPKLIPGSALFWTRYGASYDQAKDLFNAFARKAYAKCIGALIDQFKEEFASEEFQEDPTEDIPAHRGEVLFSTDVGTVLTTVKTFHCNRLVLSHDKMDIVAQAPLDSEESRIDFIKIILAENIRKVVMLCNNEEIGTDACPRYYSTVSSDFMRIGNDFSIMLKDSKTREDLDGLVISTFSVAKDQPRELVHIHYPHWDPKDIPSRCPGVCAIINEMVDIDNSFIHSSLGVGRTGVYAMVATLMREIMESKSLNLEETLTRIRRHRWHAVETPLQYVYPLVDIGEYAKMRGLFGTEELKMYEKFKEEFFEMAKMLPVPSVDPVKVYPLKKATMAKPPSVKSSRDNNAKNDTTVCKTRAPITPSKPEGTIVLEKVGDGKVPPPPPPHLLLPKKPPASVHAPPPSKTSSKKSSKKDTK